MQSRSRRVINSYLWQLDIKIQGETLNVTQEILDRYNVPGPRYTSYPTAPEWVDSFGPADFEQALTAIQ